MHSVLMLVRIIVPVEWLVTGRPVNGTVAFCEAAVEDSGCVGGRRRVRVSTCRLVGARVGWTRHGASGDISYVLKRGGLTFGAEDAGGRGEVDQADGGSVAVKKAGGLVEDVGTSHEVINGED